MKRLAELCREYDVPGASVAISEAGRETFATYGVLNRDTGVEVTEDSVFMIQSVTKVWTATLVLQLVDDGLLELDRPVREYLPGFRAGVTSRHLLAHTGGFEGDLWQPTTCGPDALERFVADVVAPAPQHCAPGRMYSYCSAGYGVLGHLVQVLRGVEYPVALRHHLADPLGIEQIAFDADEALRFRTAIGHFEGHPLRHWAVMPGSNPAAGNQLAMSARALLAFGLMHLAEGLAPAGTRVLSPAAARAMREPQVDHPAAVGPPARHGLGWRLPARPGVVEHGGNVIGSDALLRTVPEQGVAVVIMTNGGRGGTLASVLADEVLRERAGIEPAPPLPVPAPAPVEGRYAGSYGVRTGRAEVTVEDGRLWLMLHDRAEAVDLAERAGVPSRPSRYEMRRLHGEVFILLSAGNPAFAAEFLDLDPAGRPGFLHIGRAFPRVSA
ncbi:MAG TPA: serine hydrolase domain-containing protein [Mycobacteriales bacterium]|nr:serine hydrolase domain-containing protein [Mycobacteriales bacterium]